MLILLPYTSPGREYGTEFSERHVLVSGRGAASHFGAQMIATVDDLFVINTAAGRASEAQEP